MIAELSLAEAAVAALVAGRPEQREAAPPIADLIAEHREIVARQRSRKIGAGGGG